MTKRLFALLLAAVLLLGTLPVQALAEEVTEAATEATEATEETTEETTEATEEPTEATEETTELPELPAATPIDPTEEETTEPTEQTTEPTEPSTEPEGPSPEAVFQAAGNYLTQRGTPSVGSVGGEWAVIGLARAGWSVSEGYYQNVLNHVQASINPSTSRLNKNKSTENARVILALTALGYDVTNVGGYDLLAGLDEMSYLRRQGVNGPIWALIAFDCYHYTIPEGDVTRDGLIQYILGKQLSDGGWALSGSTSDPDMTGMALTALAPYRSRGEVSAAVDTAVAYLSRVQTDDGGYISSGELNSESIAQVIVALTALGIDPVSDARFVKNGYSTVDALCAYAVEGGGFAHAPGQSRDGMATEQGYFALAAYFRLLEGRTSLYDMSDVSIRKEEKRYNITSGGGSTWTSGDGAVKLVSDGPLAELEGVTVNGTAVDSGSYTIGSDAASVTFKTAYLGTLSSGKYTVALQFTDRKATTTLTIVDETDAAAAVAEVEEAIEAIGTVTQNSEAKIRAAREAYDALTDHQKKQVENYDTLLDAEEALEELADQITVTFSILGDREHDSDSDGSVHTLAGGGLSTWAAARNYTVKKGSTVKTVLDLVLKSNAMSCSNPTGNYVEAITKGGVTIGEFTNGRNSGWMYTLNGTHPNQGIAQQTVQEGDVIVFHYTDDYTKEEGNQRDPTADSEAEYVEALIDAIGTPITLDSEPKMALAREAYDKLTDAGKAKVGNYAKLVEAETALAQLKAADGSDAYRLTGDFLESLGVPGVGAVGGEWMVLGLARSGRQVPQGYYENLTAYVRENINEKQQLHRAKSTDNARVILALTAIGKDVTDVDGHNLLAGLTDLDYVQKQGINGPIWALIAFDSGNYPIPDGNVTREVLLSTILDAQLSDGGWALSGTVSDPDMTGMALQALAGYYENDGRVQAAVDTAVTALSQMQSDNGAYAGIDGASSESIAQVIVALTALGIDPDTDERFIKNGISALDALLSFFVEGGGFRHVMSGEPDGMATEQAYYALTAYQRLLEGKTRLYDMTDILDLGGDPGTEAAVLLTAAPEAPQEEAVEEGTPLWPMVLGFAISFGAVFLLAMGKNKRIK